MIPDEEVTRLLDLHAMQLFEATGMIIGIVASGDNRIAIRCTGNNMPCCSGLFRTAATKIDAQQVTLMRLNN
jgi:hypothetical protein